MHPTPIRTPQCPYPLQGTVVRQLDARLAEAAGGGPAAPSAGAAASAGVPSWWADLYSVLTWVGLYSLLAWVNLVGGRLSGGGQKRQEKSVRYWGMGGRWGCACLQPRTGKYLRPLYMPSAS